MTEIPQIPQNSRTLYKMETFEEFLKLLKGGPVPHWSSLAKALGVDRETIARWKQHPEAQKAIAAGITDALTKMEKAGKDDWKMWAEKLKILGIKVDSEERDSAPGSITVIFSPEIKRPEGTAWPPVAPEKIEVTSE